VFGACFEQQLPPHMPSSPLAGDRRSAPTVAIVGNDAVLAAAPATPVQLAHACLRRGFTVAVPASWGDELLAGETVRQLASRERGPAVMCVCPYVRSRLLAPGPDLAPFLVSLVAPPVATARYLRAAYGEHGVHITYIGGCPGADDASIDVHLTPDDFLADLAAHGVALSEQPLVFDSIVPPDRRRWCSLPGGVPSAEVLWSESDARTLIEIERDDVSTDLAQHIITREHVLLDLAPSMGCACSGAVGSVPPRSARVAVIALEPPRALGPIVDPAAAVALDAPLSEPPLGGSREGAEPNEAAVVDTGIADTPVMERVLDELLGAEPSVAADSTRLESDVATSVTIDEPLVLELAIHERAATPPTVRPGEHGGRPELGADASEASDASGDVSPVVDLRDVLIEVPDDTPVAIVIEPTGAREEIEESTTHGASRQPATPRADTERLTQSAVRRRTPAAAHARYSSATIPKATGADGRPLPRAYVAKRRTPPGVAVIIPGMGDVAGSQPPVEPPRESGVLPSGGPREVPGESADMQSPEPSAPARMAPAVTEPATATPDASAPSDAARATIGETATPREEVPGTPAATPKGAPAPSPAPGRSTVESSIRSDAEAGARSVAAPAANQGALMFLLVTALVALGAFVLFSLRR
jgi:hypothetical protein